jgi:tetratricopeptide (TPR) repeat protein
MISARAKYITIVALALVLTIAAVVAVRVDAWTKWRVHALVGRAEALAKSGSKDAARTACLKALELDRDSIPATRTLLGLLPRSDVQGALLLHVRIADLDPNDHANLHQLAHSAIIARRFDLAETATRDLERATGKTVQVLELRARVPAARGDFGTAREAAQALLEQAPGNPAGRLILALSQLFTDGPSSGVETELTSLSEIESVRMEALRGLREAALRQGDHSRALELAERVVKDPLAGFSDWLVRAELSARLNPFQLDALLADLTTRAGTDPHALGRVAAWLRKYDTSDRIEKWAAETEALRKDPVTAQMIRAETFAAREEWEKLETLLADIKWPGLEFLRDALLARAARGRQDAVGASKAWRSAVQAAIADPKSTRMLAETAATWRGWEADREELLWRAAVEGPQFQAWALTELWQEVNKRRDTRQLRRISEEMCRAFPESVPAKNNFAFYSLLLGDSTQRAHQIAEELYAAHPDHPAITSTYALSLLNRDRAGEALAALEKLPPPARHKDGGGVYYALALARTGKVEQARAIAATIPFETLLPEERALLSAIPSN